MNTTRTSCKGLFDHRWYAPLLLVACMVCGPAAAQETDQLDVHVERVLPTTTLHKKTFNLRTSGFVRATPGQVWQVLTDYARLPNFVPNLLSVRVVARDGNDRILEQHGRANMLFLRQEIHMLVRVTEHPMSAIDIVLISGDMQHYEAHWRMTPTEKNGVTGTQIDYKATMTPDFLVPPMIGLALIEEDVKKMTLAVMAEISQRAAQ
jgi:ribosome-associated toxin RatA of RatAB toxin-antitoxin module